jgi:putative SOS response-associated peptidase YedK
MCYKVSVRYSDDYYENRFHRKFKPGTERKPIYHGNAFAVPSLPVITMAEPGEIQVYEWPLIPHYARTDDDAKKQRFNLANAKSETIFELTSFKSHILKRRCLVLADGFFESMDVNGIKYPHFIYRKDQQPFAFAGIYNHWKKPSGEWVSGISIITTEPNELLRKIHNVKLRMPVILPPNKENKWIEADLLNDEIKDLMVPLEDGILTAHPVDNRINKSKEFTDEPTIVEVYNYDALTGVTY